MSNREYYRLVYSNKHKDCIKIVHLEISQEEGYDFVNPYRYDTYEEANLHAQRYIVIQGYNLDVDKFKE